MKFGLTPDNLHQIFQDENYRPSAREVLDKLHCDPLKGIDSNTVKQRQEAFGKNVLPKKTLRSLLSFIWESLEDVTLLILIGSAAFSIGFGLTVAEDQSEVIQGVAILIAVVIVSGVTSIQNWTKEKEFRSLNDVRDDREITVVRDGEATRVSKHDLVVGDIMPVESGDIVPADGYLLEGFGLQVDESSLTGEPHHVSKREGKDIIMMGLSKIVSGSGKMVVLAVGENSECGRLVASVEHSEREPTPLETKLEGLAEQIGYFALAAGVATSLALTVIWFMKEPGPEGRNWIDLLRFFIVGLTIIVVAVPEGLPLSVTISLAFSMRRMMKDNNLVRNLQSCETMGSATFICSDKTGTLTENKMKVVKGYLFGKQLNSTEEVRELVEAHRESPPDEVGAGQVKLGQGPGDLFLLGTAANSTAELGHHHDAKGKIVKGEENRYLFIGNSTEAALLEFTQVDCKVPYTALRTQPKRLWVENFTAAKKRMGTILEAPFGQDGPAALALVKGGPEIILEYCSHTYQGDEIVPLDNAAKTHIRKVLNQFAESGLRTLALAHKRDQFPAQGDWESKGEELAFNGLVLDGIAGVEDPVREAVPKAMERCKKAGVRVMMITGDMMATAQSVARQCGILPDKRSNDPQGSHCLLGSEVRKRDKEGTLKDIVRDIAVVARASPADKHILVTALKELGEVVAVTGDGTNDAPALSAANVGLSMGISGTEIAKEASDIIILDDNFRSIVLAVLWGRSILENIRKFLVFQLTINVTALMLTFIVACTNGGSTTKFPLTPVQLLWVNLIMDSFAALALATEPPDKDLLHRRPGGLSLPLITSRMWKNIIFTGLFQTGLLVWLAMTHSGAEFLGASDFEGRHHYTMVFTTFVMLQVFNIFHCRRVEDEFDLLHGWGGAAVGHAILGIIVLGQFLMVEFGGELADTVSLTFVEWTQCIVLGFASIVVGFIVKSIPLGKGALEQ